MSRPFSYNDDNFTVIGNILILHYICNNAYAVGDKIGDIPPAIYNRLKSYNNQAVLSNSNQNGGPSTANIVVNTNMEIISRTAIASTDYKDRLLLAFFIIDV